LAASRSAWLAELSRAFKRHRQGGRAGSWSSIATGRAGPRSRATLHSHPCNAAWPFGSCPGSGGSLRSVRCRAGWFEAVAIGSGISPAGGNRRASLPCQAEPGFETGRAQHPQAGLAKPHTLFPEAEFGLSFCVRSLW